MAYALNQTNMSTASAILQSADMHLYVNMFSHCCCDHVCHPCLPVSECVYKPLLHMQSMLDVLKLDPSAAGLPDEPWVEGRASFRLPQLCMTSITIQVPVCVNKRDLLLLLL